jgi:hypothetical protein
MADDPQFAAFIRALENIKKCVDGLDGHDARVALTISLADSIVFGDDDMDDELRLPFVLRTLGGIVADMMLGPGDDDWDDDDPPPPPHPSTDLLRKLIERRRATQPAKG